MSKFSNGAIVSLGFLLVLFVLVGCGQGIPAGVAPTVAVMPAIQGRVHGGEQPIVGASIQIYAAGMPSQGGGYGTGSVGLIQGTLPITDSGGNFQLTGLYALPATASFLYLVSTGGSPGPGAAVNSHIFLMAVLDKCTGTSVTAPFSSDFFVDMDEVSTIGAVFALQNYMSAPSAANGGIPSVGAPSTDDVGLQDAMETVSNLVNLRTGTSVIATSDWATAPTNALTTNTLADILVYCVNSDPASSGNCSTLFADATPGSDYTATNTIQAAWYMAQNPTTNIHTLFSLVPPSPPFIALVTEPASFALPVATSASACQAPVPLLTAANFNILAASAVTSSGLTTITGGNLGLNPGISVTGFPPGVIVLPAMAYIADPTAAQAQQDAAAAYNYMTGLANGALLPTDVSNLTLTPGLYVSTTTVTLNTGTLTLDAQGDGNAVFLFQIGTTLTTFSGTQVVLANGAQAKNVFWSVGTSATLGTTSTFEGTVIADQSITVQTGVSITGRALALNAAVTLDSVSSTAP